MLTVHCNTWPADAEIALGERCKREGLGALILHLGVYFKIQLIDLQEEAYTHTHTHTHGQR